MMDQLTPHFSFDELTTTGVRDLAAANRAGAVAHRGQLQSLAELLERARTACGDRPFSVHSAFRSPAVNARIGGSTTSQHMRGEACDFHVVGLPLSEAFAAIREAGLPFGQIILEGGAGVPPSWIHLSLGAPWRPASRCGEALIFDGHRYKPAG